MPKLMGRLLEAASASAKYCVVPGCEAAYVGMLMACAGEPSPSC